MILFFLLEISINLLPLLGIVIQNLFMSEGDNCLSLSRLPELLGCEIVVEYLKDQSRKCLMNEVHLTQE